MNAHCITGNFVQIIFEICTVDYVKTLKKTLRNIFLISGTHPRTTNG